MGCLDAIARLFVGILLIILASGLASCQPVNGSQQSVKVNAASQPVNY